MFQSKRTSRQETLEYYASYEVLLPKAVRDDARIAHLLDEGCDVSEWDTEEITAVDKPLPMRVLMSLCRLCRNNYATDEWQCDECRTKGDKK